jgi:hypothetical protein
LGSAAFADGLTYGRYSLDYSTADFGDSTASNTIFEGEVEYEIGQVLLSASGMNTSFNDGEITYQAQDFEAAAGYRITPEVLVGAGVLLSKYNYGEDETYYEVFGQYVTDQVSVAANVMNYPDYDYTYRSFYGEASVIPTVTVGAVLSNNSDQDGNAYYLSGEYNEGPIDARAFVAGHTEYEGGLFGARATYEFGSRYRAAGTIGKPTGEFAPDITFLTVGGGVEITDGVWFDASYAMINGNDAPPDDVYTLRAKISYEFGERARVDRRMEQAIMDDISSIVGGGPN